MTGNHSLAIFSINAVIFALGGPVPRPRRPSAPPSDAQCNKYNREPVADIADISDEYIMFQTIKFYLQHFGIIIFANNVYNIVIIEPRHFMTHNLIIFN